PPMPYRDPANGSMISTGIPDWRTSIPEMVQPENTGLRKVKRENVAIGNSHEPAATRRCVRSKSERLRLVRLFSCSPTTLLSFPTSANPPPAAPRLVESSMDFPYV